MAKGCGSKGRSDLDTGDWQSWMSPADSNRWPTKTRRSGSSSTGRSSTTPLSVPNWRHVGTDIARVATPKRSCICTKKRASVVSNGFKGCLPLPFGIECEDGSSWRETGWASSRSTMPLRIVSSCLPRKSKASWLPVRSGPSSTTPSYLSFSPPASSRVRRPFSAGYESCCPGELSHGPPLTRSESDATGGCLSRWTDRGRSSRCGHANCGVD